MTPAVHIIQNHPRATAAGQGDLLVPGYTLLASCKAGDDMPSCHFELPIDDERPIFIVPSVASGEQGDLTLVVGFTEPVDVIEVPPKVRNLWGHKWSTVVTWSQCRPNSRYLGGKRSAQSAPCLSWYRNPQFRVRIATPSNQACPGTTVDDTLAAADAAEEASEGGLSKDSADEVAESLTFYQGGVAKARLPFLQAFLVPVDKHQAVPVAVHIVRNLTSVQDKVEENSMRHSLLASSGVARAEYQVGSEIGAACALPQPVPRMGETAASSSSASSQATPAPMQAEEASADCVFVVPSLATTQLEGSFTLHIVTTTPVEIQQVH